MGISLPQATNGCFVVGNERPTMTGPGRDATFARPVEAKLPANRLERNEPKHPKDLHGGILGDFGRQHCPEVGQQPDAKTYAITLLRLTHRYASLARTLRPYTSGSFGHGQQRLPHLRRSIDDALR
jgi:hypothetical protein